MDASQEAINAFIAGQKNLILATIASDGSPQLSPLWFDWDGERFVISTITDTAKWRNLHRDRRCTICIDDPDTGQMIVSPGSADLIEGAAIEAPTRAILKRYYPDRPADAQAHYDRIMAGPERVVIAFTPDRFITRNLAD